MLYLDLIHNVALLVALAAGFQMIGRTLERHPNAYRWIAALLFGLVGVIGMMTPVSFSPGVIYDGRSIILTLAGLFCGPAAILAAALCSFYRLDLGGAGAVAGVAVIIEATLLGIAVYYLRRRSESWVRMPQLLGLGLLVHAVMMALQLLIPGIDPRDLMSRIGLGVIVFFPLAFLLSARFFLDAEKSRATRVERELLMAAIEQAGESIAITDLDSKLRYVNPVFERTTGYLRDEVIGRDPGFLASGEHDADFFREISSTVRSGRTWKGRLVSRRKDGSLYTEDVSVSPVTDEAGEIVHFVTVARDVGEQLALEKRFQHAQRLESVGRLAGGVAHDLNNLLSPILGFSDLLLTDLATQDPRHKFAQGILLAAQRARDIVGQLLAFSRKQVISLSSVSLNELLTDLEPLLRRTVREDIRLHLHLTPELPPIRGDSGQLGQVFVNLAVNAQDAMPDGGDLHFETRTVDPTDLGAEADAEQFTSRPVCVTVTDTGSGIDPELLAHIFDPFFTTKGQDKGTGLGLSTSHGIITQHGGIIQVESFAGAGTTFRLFFPVDEHPPLEQQPPSIVPPATKGTLAKGVLVVEDDEQVAALTNAVLERFGCQVFLARSPEAAIALAKDENNSIDLLLTDVIMPGMNGRQLYQAVQALRPGLPVLYMSGYPDEVIAHQGVLDRGVHFIQKPFTVDALWNQIRAVLNT